MNWYSDVLSDLSTDEDYEEEEDVSAMYVDRIIDIIHGTGLETNHVR